MTPVPRVTSVRSIATLPAKDSHRKFYSVCVVAVTNLFLGSKVSGSGATRHRSSGVSTDVSSRRHGGSSRHRGSPDVAPRRGSQDASSRASRRTSPYGSRAGRRTSFDARKHERSPAERRSGYDGRKRERSASVVRYGRSNHHERDVVRQRSVGRRDRSPVRFSRRSPYVSTRTSYDHRRAYVKPYVKPSVPSKPREDVDQRSRRFLPVTGAVGGIKGPVAKVGVKVSEASTPSTHRRVPASLPGSSKLPVVSVGKFVVLLLYSFLVACAYGVHLLLGTSTGIQSRAHRSNDADFRHRVGASRDTRYHRHTPDHQGTYSRVSSRHRFPSRGSRRHSVEKVTPSKSVGHVDRRGAGDSGASKSVGHSSGAVTVPAGDKDVAAPIAVTSSAGVSLIIKEEPVDLTADDDDEVGPVAAFPYVVPGAVVGKCSNLPVWFVLLWCLFFRSCLRGGFLSCT